MDKRDKGYTLYKKGLSCTEISKKLDVSINTVKSWRKRYWTQGADAPAKRTLHPEDAAANYADISTWMWSLVRDMAQSGRLHLPNDTELIAQLSTRKYAFAGTPPKLKLESKEIMKRRGLPSPDRADAVALSLYQPVTYTWEIG